MQNWSHYILGLALGLVTITPILSVGGIRVGYGLILVVAIWRFLAVQIKVPRAALMFLFWLIPLSYALVLDLYRFGADGFSLFARSALTLLGGFMLMTEGQDSVALRRIMLGASPIIVINAIVAIMQYFGSVDAILLGMYFSGAEGVEAMRDELAVGQLRPSGLQGASHVFAYVMGVWGFLYSWVAIRARPASTQVVLLWLVAVIAVTSVILSAQRSVVWLVVPGLFILYFLRYRGFSRLIVAGGAVAFLIIIVSGAELMSDAGVLNRLANFAGSTSGDLERQETWRLAWAIIMEDPLAGSAYVNYEFHRGIHNGFLNGWARYGLVWLILVASGLVAYLYSILARRSSLSDQFGACTLFALVLANAMFHTTGPGIGDTMVFAALPFGLLCGTSSEMMGKT